LVISGKTALSPSVGNEGFVLKATGDEIAALGSTAGVQVARCTLSGSGFIQDHVYYRKVDGTWAALNQIIHTHDQDDDDSGGIYYKILLANQTAYYSIRYGGPFFNVMYNQTSGTGNFIGLDQALGVTKLSTGAVATASANTKTGWMPHDWGQSSKFWIKFRVDSASQVIARAGVNVEAMGDSNNAGAKYGIEGCDSTGTSFQLVSASNTTRSLLGTTLPLSETQEKNYRLEHIPGGPGTGAIKLTRDLYTTSPFWVKTTDPPPASGVSDQTKTVSMGIKTQDTNIKTMYIHGFAFDGRPSGP
jgi:hypothetical protein